MKKLRSTIITIMAVLGLVAIPLAPASTTFANQASQQISQGVTSVGGTGTGQQDLKDGIKTIVNVMLFILGAIAVIMIIIGGIRYATSNGDASNTKAAKDTILYAVIGLVVAILSYAIVNFIVNDAFGK